MDEMWQVIAELGVELHPERMSALAAKVASIHSVQQFNTELCQNIASGFHRTITVKM